MVPGRPLPSSAGPPSTVEVSPAKDSKNMPVSTEIGTKVTNGKVQGVVLADASGQALAGQMRDDLTSWVPDTPLKYSTAYTATVTVLGDDGQTVTASTAFSTMGKPSKRNGVGLYLFEKQGVRRRHARRRGVQQPRAGKRPCGSPIANVRVDSPDQPGRGTGAARKQSDVSGRELLAAGYPDHRRIALEGHPMGDGRYGDATFAALATSRPRRSS
jgi:hypothetical protein